MRVPTFVLLVLTCMLASTAGQIPGAAGLSTVTVTVDADPDTAGVQATRAVANGETFSIDILIGSVSDLQAFNFELEYDQTLLSAPTVTTGPDTDRNPDAEETFLTSTGRVWSCSPPSPSGDADPSPSVGAAFLSCFSTGAIPGPSVGPTETPLATVEFNAVAVGTSPLTLRNVNLFKEGGVETGSCNPVVVTAATCTGASVTVSAPGDCPDPGSVPWSVPPGDSDCDGFADADEGLIGTDPNVFCGPGCWPSDFDDNQVINILDVNMTLPPHFGMTSSSPGWDPRYDLKVDDVINILDVNMTLPPFFGYVCGP